ncbi:MAG TPA: lytic murein transglycosylase [Candidatus Paceibacterota bacterium]|nr:lytic murein transglycosylase [Candidatus Paceibacterota bacterium]
MRFQTKKIFARLTAGMLTSLMLFLAVFPGFPGVVSIAQAQSVDDISAQRAQYQAQLDQLQKEIAEKQTLLNSQHQKSTSLENEISTLQTEIDKSKLEIQARDIAIQTLSGNISDTQKKVEDLNTQISQVQGQLASLIRETDEKDNHSLVEVVLGSKNFSDFFTDVEDYSAVKNDLKQNLDIIKEAHIQTKSKEDQLTEQKIQQQGLRQIQLLEKAQIQDNQNKQADLLKQSKSQENFYQDTIESKKKQVAQIKAALFALQGSNTNINFGQALELAKEVQKSTGVRPAFLLAILTQETRIGQNIGSCNIPGKTPGRMWNDIMPGPGDGSSRDDQTIYLQIVQSLGISPTARPLSCPQSVGWGGAMGPAQFIPTTWQGLIPAVRAATGSVTPDPWNPRDAFFAAGIFLARLGAGTQASEMEAAGRYFAGSNWNTLGVGYANSVEALAQSIQTDKIDPIESVGN